MYGCQPDLHSRAQAARNAGSRTWRSKRRNHRRCKERALDTNGDAAGINTYPQTRRHSTTHPGDYWSAPRVAGGAASIPPASNEERHNDWRYGFQPHGACPLHGAAVYAPTFTSTTGGAPCSCMVDHKTSSNSSRVNAAQDPTTKLLSREQRQHNERRRRAEMRQSADYASSQRVSQSMRPVRTLEEDSFG